MSRSKELLDPGILESPDFRNPDRKIRVFLFGDFMGLHREERLQRKAEKERRIRKLRRRERLWLSLQSRTHTHERLWDDKARDEKNIEKYRLKVNRDTGVWDNRGFYEV